MLKSKEMEALINHYQTYLGELETLDYTPSREMTLKPQILLSKATAQRGYHVIATTGVSEVKLKGSYPSCELIMLLDKKWKFKFDNANYNWPLELLHKIGNMLYLADNSINYGQHFINDNNKPFSSITDMGVVLVGVPAMFNKGFFELHAGKKVTNFFVLIPATFDELNLIKRMGGINFIQRYLLPEGETAFVVKNKI